MDMMDEYLAERIRELKEQRDRETFPGIGTWFELTYRIDELLGARLQWNKITREELNHETDNVTA